MNLRIGLCNINCLFRRRFKVRDILSAGGFAMVGLVETRLKPESALSSAFFPGYTLYRHDRCMRRGGGVALLVRSTFLVRVVSVSAEKICERATDIPAEYALYHVSSVEFGCLLVLLVYRPPGTASYSALFDVVSEFLCLAPRCLIMGDFNYRLNSDSIESTEFLRSLDDLGFLLARFGPTYFDHNGASELELVGGSGMLLSDPAKITDPLPGGHVFLSCIVNFERRLSPLPASVARRRRDWSGYSRDALVSVLAGFDWSAFSDPLSSPDILATLMAERLMEGVDSLAPWRASRAVGCSRRDPWRTAQLDELDRRCSALYKRYRRNGCRDTLLEFRRLRSRSECLYSQSFNDFFRPRIARCTSQADIWHLFERYGLLGSPGSLPTYGVDPAAFARFLTDLPGGPDPVDDLRAFVLSRRGSADDEAERFFFQNITTEDVLAEALRLVGSRCAGSDGIYMSYVLDGIGVLGPLLADLFNAIIAHGEYPSGWKKSVVKPIPKRPSPVSPSDFRPISLQPVFAKIFEGIVLRQMNAFLEGSDRLNPHQFGFRPGRSTEHAVLDFVERTRESIGRGAVVLVVFLDFTVAFNSVYTSAIVSSFLDAGFSNSSVLWLADCLTGRSFCIDTGGERSGYFPYERGFGQGTRIGPVLYLGASNDFPRCLRPGVRHHLFADDSTVERDASSLVPGLTIPQLRDDLVAVTRWAESKGLIINPSKSVFVGFGRPSDMMNMMREPPSIDVAGCNIQMVFEAKYLGVWLDSTFSWKRQARHMTSRVFGSLRRLSYLRGVLNPQSRIMLVRALCLVHLDYCCCVLSGADVRTCSSSFAECVHSFCYGAAAQIFCDSC